MAYNLVAFLPFPDSGTARLSFSTCYPIFFPLEWLLKVSSTTLHEGQHILIVDKLHIKYRSGHSLILYVIKPGVSKNPI